jgi:triacylglycerol esterase/lipase EstA (alpha/beta hydrolase family)
MGLRLRGGIAALGVTMLGLGVAASATPAGAAPAAAGAVAPSAVSSCRVTAAHPFPVVLVHGTFENSGMWSQFQPVLQQAGFCVSAIDYNSTQDIAVSARQLSTFVDQVLAASGGTKVDIVGHSQGGMLPRYFLKNLNGAPRTHSLIAFAPSNYGTTLAGLELIAGPFVAALCTSCGQQLTGSPFLVRLNNPSDTTAGVNYTVIESSHDEVVTPFTNAFLRSSGVTNQLIQNSCPADAAGHIALATEDRNAWRLALNALDPAHAQPVNCVAELNPL